MEFSRSDVALLLIDVQKGFHDPVWGNRNNLAAEENIKMLLQFFRKVSAFIIHIQHLSTEPDSPLRPGQFGVEFMDSIRPQGEEMVFQKSVNSAFIGTELERYLREKNVHLLFMVGFTSDHCVSTTTRMAANLGFKTVVVSDAVVTFQRFGIGGRILSADLVHEVSLASLADEFASIRDTNSILSSRVL